MLVWSGGIHDSVVKVSSQGRGMEIFAGCLRKPINSPYPEDEADDGHSRRGHDFSTVGHKVQQYGHDALRSVVKLVTQY